MDWGEATVIMAGEQVTVQLFILRLCYSRKVFVMAFPTQRQEAFLFGHVLAFAYFGGVPQRLIYDNLKTAVQEILEGRNRIEQTDFCAVSQPLSVRKPLLHAGARARKRRGGERGRLQPPQLPDAAADGG